MQFPKWVNQTGYTKEQRASNRLQYIINRLAIDYSREGTLTALCKKVGVSHSTVSYYVNLGQFSFKMADAFQKTFGKDKVLAEWLREPLAIKVTSK